MKRRILFLTGTRADFGKLKPLMKAVEQSPEFINSIFVTGMHTLSRYGNTVEEVRKTGFKYIHMYMNQTMGEPMDVILANTILGLSRFISENKPDMIVVHGDRVEALAGAIVGALNNILVVHVEGGELSGTIDGLIRHSISKLAHIHFVANQEAADRLRQLGEDPDTVFVIGSPDVDVMMSEDLPTIETVRSYYSIPFQRYGILLFHPVTTELHMFGQYVEEIVKAVIESNKPFVVIYPNNDEGCEYIFRGYERFKNNPLIKIFPSLRFEYFLTLLKHADYILGNSSAGIREAPIYGTYSVNIGTRQNDRFTYPSILNVEYDSEQILQAIANIEHMPPCEPCYIFGQGDSTRRFMEVLEGERVWRINKQKQFQDLPLSIF